MRFEKLVGRRRILEGLDEMWKRKRVVLLVAFVGDRWQHLLSCMGMVVYGGLEGLLGVVDQVIELRLRIEELEVQVERIQWIESHFFGNLEVMSSMLLLC